MKKPVLTWVSWTSILVLVVVALGWWYLLPPPSYAEEERQVGLTLLKLARHFLSDIELADHFQHIRENPVKRSDSISFLYRKLRQVISAEIKKEGLTGEAESKAWEKRLLERFGRIEQLINFLNQLQSAHHSPRHTHRARPSAETIEYWRAQIAFLVFEIETRPPK